MSDANHQVILMIKAPRPGLVKTRLAQSLGAEPACAAYRRLVATLLDRLQHLPAMELRYSPDDADAEVRAWHRPGWTLAPQGEGDLGQRLAAAFQAAFSRGAERVLILGSDCPWVTEADVREGFRTLDVRDVVLGPAEDGGYWLVGLRRPGAELFREIPWSTDRVLASTLERARERGWSVGLLRRLSDVDTEEDWRKFLEEGRRE